MSSEKSVLERLSRPIVLIERPSWAQAWSSLRTLPVALADSTYFKIARSDRFRVDARRRMRAATRAGLLFAGVALTFDALTLAGLEPAGTELAIALDAAMIVATVVALLLLSGWMRHYPELIAWTYATATVGHSAILGSLVPALTEQSIGYFLLLPGVITLFLPWRTGTHIRWLLATALIGLPYLGFGAGVRLTQDERLELVIVLAVALWASLVGHVLLQRMHIRAFVYVEKIRALGRATAAANRELELARRALEISARTDPLTGAANRRRLEEDLGAVRAQIRRGGLTFGIAELDLDHFKAINDRAGHAAGDEVLRSVVEAVRKALRAEDVLYRVGGEEFVAILHTPATQSLLTAVERLRLVVAALAIAHPENVPYGIVSVSIGAALISPVDLKLSNEQWLDRADQALYAAKHAGRNRVCLSPG